MACISVIVPVYKVEPYLHRCIDSILAQTFTDFELILVDDGSPDNCGKICDEYAAKDKRICVIHQKNSGVSAARNAGLDWTFSNSDSEWIAFVDSDDWMYERLFESLLDAAIKNGTNISACSFERTFRDTPEVCENNLASELWSPEKFFVDRNTNAVVLWGKIFRKSCFQNIRFPEGKIHEDEFATYRILFAEEQIAFVDEPLYFYFQNDTGIMRSLWSEKRLAAFEARKEQLKFFSENGFSSAQHAVQKLTLWTYKGTIDRLVESHYDKKIIRRLRAELRTSIRHFKKDMDLSINSMPGIYESAYPRFMYCYWIMLALRKKLFKWGKSLCLK